jgi:hypothetical protein
MKPGLQKQNQKFISPFSLSHYRIVALPHFFAPAMQGQKNAPMYKHRGFLVKALISS